MLNFRIVGIKTFYNFFWGSIKIILLHPEAVIKGTWSVYVKI